jgi:hypothetical protein
MKDLKGIYDSSEIQEQDKPGHRHDDQPDDKTGDPEESLLKSRDHSRDRDIYDSSEIHEPEKPGHDHGLDKTEDQEDIVKSQDRDYPKDRGIYDTSEIHEPEKPDRRKILEPEEEDN